MTNSAKSRAKKNNIPFSISWENLTEVYKGICPILGLPLDWHSSKIMTDNSPSLDKIIPETGYAKGNIQIISWKANKMKNNATSEELNNFAKWVLKC